ncbi:hypothetical protein [Pseudoroseicyclus sp. CXY001]|uniref:hypothetical protein n=1 Tax=Pseudoroseicyclus sp. CXY001 TaxID=3242492 RepID=UPI0035711820
MNRRRFLSTSAAAAAAVAARPALAAEAILLRDLYNRDMTFTELALSLEGREVTLEGYMAPPLKADSTFFVLTRRPLTVCPFCETEAEWPDDIAAIHTRRIYDVQPFNVKLLTTGILELGPETEPDTGFVSRLRLTEARFDRV